MPPTAWRKSSFSTEPDDNCVEVALAPLAVAVRDSKNTTGSNLAFGPLAWRALIETVAR